MRLLAYSIDSSGALDQADNGPWQVVVDNDSAVLKILAFAQHIGRDQDSELFLGRHAVLLFITSWAESPRQRRWIRRVPRHRGHVCYSSALKVSFEIAHRIGELSENQHLAVGMIAEKQILQCAKLRILLSPPISKSLQQVAGGGRIVGKDPCRGPQRSDVKLATETGARTG